MPVSHRILGVSRADLLRLGAKDLKVFLGASRISNELNISTKMLWFARAGFFDARIDEIAERIGQQAFFAYHLCLLAGHAYEASIFLDSSNFRRVAKEELLATKFEFTQPYASISDYFRGKNLIKSIRDKVSFHNDLGFLYTQIEKARQDFTFMWLEGDFLGHNVYSGAIDIILDSMLEIDKSQTLPEEALYQSSSDQIFQITDMIGQVLHLTIAYIALTKLHVTPDSMTTLPASPDGPPIDSVRLPFFCAHPLDPVFLERLKALVAKG